MAIYVLKVNTNNVYFKLGMAEGNEESIPHGMERKDDMVHLYL